jgi:GTP:adenosylcobinamide-phosphate guanylyltransferase
MVESKKISVLILAASRLGADDVVARSQNVSHKCLITLDGMIMLERVVKEIKAAKDVGRIFISIENEELLKSVPAIKEMSDKGEVQFVQSRENLYLSVLGATEDIDHPFPLLVTTADNALHTTEMVDYFCKKVLTLEPDAAIALTPAAVILEAYPEGKRAFYPLKGEDWSACNLYALMTEKALAATKAFEGGGQFGKNPQRILKAFGFIFMVLYRFKLATIDTLGKRLSKRWGIDLQLISMPFADAPIDVDNLGDVELTKKILKARRTAASGGL